jgi:hypothetical protein
VPTLIIDDEHLELGQDVYELGLLDVSGGSIH